MLFNVLFGCPHGNKIYAAQCVEMAGVEHFGQADRRTMYRQKHLHGEGR